MDLGAFQTIAEIAVTFAGFVGILVFLNPGNDGFAKLGLEGLLVNTIIVFLFSFVPDLLQQTLDMVTTWRVSCGVYGLVHLFFMARHVVMQHGMQPMSIWQKALTVISWGVIGSKLAVGLGYFEDFAYTIYYFALVFSLLIAFFFFVALILDHIGQTHDSP